MSRCTFHVGDVFAEMAKIPDHSVDLIVTSPPFLALRSYLLADHPDKGKEIGSEATPTAFLSTLLALTREWRRILAPHGSICVELGDTYAGSGGAGGDYLPGGLRDGQNRAAGSSKFDRSSGRRAPGGQPYTDMFKGGGPGGPGWPLPKSLCGIPTLYAWSLAYGHNLLDPADRIEPWRIRNLIVWHRPNPPVGALGDKVRPSTSYITVACTSDKRWFDLDAERGVPVNGHQNPATRGYGGYADKTSSDAPCNPAGAPPLDCWIDGDVWTIPTAPYKGAHYATFPIALPRRLINLMCPRHVCVVCGEPRRRITGEAGYVQTRTGAAPASMKYRGDGRPIGGGVMSPATSNGDNGVTRTAPTLGWTDCGHDNYRRGLVLDPFAGSGTTLAAAAESGRDAIGIDLDERNLDLARERIGLFLEEPA